jgi:hypothetical protein
MTLMVQCLFFTFFEISANQRLLWALAAMLDDRLEQKVTKLDQDLVRSISAKHGSNPCVTFVPIRHPTWLPGDILASDWMKFLKIFFSDTTGGWNLKLS